MFPRTRMRRSRRTEGLRFLAQETVLSPADFIILIGELMGDKLNWSCEWNQADEVFKLWTDNALAFLNKIRHCRPAVIGKAFDKASRKDARLCLGNLKAVEPEWRKFVDKDNCLQVWVDGY